MNRNTFFGALLSATIVAATGAALAADTQPGTEPGNSGSSAREINQSAPGVGPDATTSDMPAAIHIDRSNETLMQPAVPPGSMIGKEIYNGRGDKIGKVSRIVGNQVVVPIGGFLGIGTHDIALQWGKITTSGTGDYLTLHTPLTEDEIKNLPKFGE
jgi:hypothetical protein